MDHSCDPGLHRLAHVLMKDLDLDLNDVPVAEPKAEIPSDDTAHIFKGTIITMAGGKLSPVESLAIHGAKIIAAGPLAQSEQAAKQAAGSQVHVRELAGKCILPGFIEPHLHLLLTALVRKFLVDFSPLKVSSLDTAESLVKETVANIKDLDYWVAGFGWDPSRVAHHCDLNIDLLDAWSWTTINHEQVSVPILIVNQSGHLAYFNNAALEKAGIDPGITDPDFIRKDGKLTGVVVEVGISKIAGSVPMPRTGETWAKLCKPVIESWAKAGCTTVFDAGIGNLSSNDFQLMKCVTTSRLISPLPLRFLGAVSINYIAGGGEMPSNKPPLVMGNVHVRSIKYWADGSTQGFTAAVNEPYINNLNPRGDPCGTLNYPPDPTTGKSKLQGLMAEWLERGWQLIVHANGDRATDQVLDIYKAILPKSRKDKMMHRIEHFTVTSSGCPNQVTRAAALGLGVSHTIGHVYYWGQAFKEWVLGCHRAMRIDPVHDDSDHNLSFSFHSDSPVTDVYPLLYIKTAVNRLMYNSHKTLGEDQRVDLETALRGVTINAAEHVLMGDEIGSLEVGKSADLVILGEDIRKAPQERIDEIKVVETWLKGRKV